MADNAPLSEIQRLTNYSRFLNPSTKETWEETVDRILYSDTGLFNIGKFTDDEKALIETYVRAKKAHGSARWYWIGGTAWIGNPENYSGAYNCTSLEVTSFAAMAELMNLAMQGSGTGAMLESKFIEQLPEISKLLDVKVIGYPGLIAKEKRNPDTAIHKNFIDNAVYICVGDSRQGWVKAYQEFLELSDNNEFVNGSNIDVTVDLSNVRPPGEPLKSFGGTANPVKLPEFWGKLAAILNGAYGRKLLDVEVCLLIDEAALVVVAGNIRRSAGMRQFDSSAPNYKLGVWAQDSFGNWYMPDPKRQSLTMANHTRVYHHKPTLDELKEAVRLQHQSGEGAIQFAPEAIARSNADILTTKSLRDTFIEKYLVSSENALGYLEALAGRQFEAYEAHHRLNRYGLNPCGEVVGNSFHCNLSSVHLNTLDPFNLDEQIDAFKASALQACALLHHRFSQKIHQDSRELDPIIGVSFTGAFTFFTKLFGVDWLKWWAEGRPEDYKVSDDTLQRVSTYHVFKHFAEDYKNNTLNYVLERNLFKLIESFYLQFWKPIVSTTITDYCQRNGLKVPNRYTTLKPEGSLTLLTGVGACGHHAPKGWYYIRRKTFERNNPVALAALDYGYKVVPGQHDLDENGKLLDDPFDPRCTEWLVEIPVEEEIVRLFPEAITIDPNKFSFKAQWDFYLQVQNHYVTHNTSATLELTETEIDTAAECIYDAIQNNNGYISSALLAREVPPLPRLPFEVISKKEYQKRYKEVLKNRISDDFTALLNKRLTESTLTDEPTDSACNDGFCAIK